MCEKVLTSVKNYETILPFSFSLIIERFEPQRNKRRVYEDHFQCFGGDMTADERW